MLNRRTKYAIKALVFLAKATQEHQHVSVSTISKETSIPIKFLEAILTDLKASGVLDSKKGSTGGYFFAKNPRHVFLTEVIRSINGPIALLPCASLNYYEPCETCIDENACSLHEVIIQVRNASLEILSKWSIEALMEREQNLAKILKN